MDWGCDDGIHCGWLVVELDSHDEVMRAVPPAFRQQARIIKLNRYTAEEIASKIAELE